MERPRHYKVVIRLVKTFDTYQEALEAGERLKTTDASVDILEVVQNRRGLTEEQYLLAL